MSSPRVFSLFSTEKPREACFDPGNIMNASRTGYDYKLGSQVSYNCHSGYVTVGGDIITCVMGNDGKPVWDKALPSCKGRRNMHQELHLRKTFPCEMLTYVQFLSSRITSTEFSSLELLQKC